jgi:SOS response regulatory protein OraA/RecX
LETVAAQGYINDEETAMRWSSQLIEEKGWGRLKIMHFLYHRGIPQEIITKVQKKIWQEHNEDEVARVILHKYLSKPKDLPSLQKRVRFLHARGFPLEVINRVVKSSLQNKGRTSSDEVF